MDSSLTERAANNHVCRRHLAGVLSDQLLNAAGRGGRRSGEGGGGAGA